MKPKPGTRLSNSTLTLLAKATSSLSLNRQKSVSINQLGGSLASSNMKKSLKGSEIATHILLLISACFVLLNVPYVIAWANFNFYEFESKRSIESISASYHRYTFIWLAKIFHIANFSINFFLYCLASKRFRKHLMVP